MTPIQVGTPTVKTIQVGTPTVKTIQVGTPTVKTIQLAVVLLLLASCAREVAEPDRAPAVEPAGLTDADRADIAAMLETQRQAWNAGNLDGFLLAYEKSDALLFTSGAKIRRGFEDTRTKYRERYGSATETMGKLEFELLDVRGIGSDGAIVLGKYLLTETPESGEGVFTLVVERQAGTWMIVHDHTSAAPPAEAVP